jgi:hypothetical protein
VIFPAIAQRLVDNASLPILSASLMNPTPDNITFSLVAQLKVPAGVTVDLKPITLNLFTNETSPSDPYIRVNLPEYHLKGNTKVEVVNDTAQILNQTQFENFLSYAVNSKEFTMQAEGATAAYLGILKAPIKLNKKVQMAGELKLIPETCIKTLTILVIGLNSIQGFSFVEAAVVFPPLADGTNLQGTVILPNPSAVTFELVRDHHLKIQMMKELTFWQGNVTLNMIVGGVIIGQGRINDVLLAPGNNTVALSATVDLKTAIENLPTLLQAEAKSLVNGNVVVSASGNSTIFNGVHIPYYEQVLNNLVITGEVPLIQILVDSLDIALGPNSTLLSGLLGVFVGGNSTNLLISFLGSLTGLGSGSSAGSSSSNIFSGLAGLLGSSTSSKSTSSASLTTAKTTPASTPASTTASTAPSTITSSPALLSALLLPSASASDNLAGLFSSLLGGL